MNYNPEELPMLNRLGSHSRSALVSFLCIYAIQHPDEVGAFGYWLSAGKVFDPYGDTRAGRRKNRLCDR
jgi:hypothetical protein